MARLARIVIPHVPHHITQRGNRRQATFFTARDYEMYCSLMRQSCDSFGVAIWAYCLMPNHIHLVATPTSETGLANAIGAGHEAYTRYINFQHNWRGYLWQGRFASFPMDERHLIAATRYIERNPVMAGLAARPEDYEWCSARSRIFETQDPFMNRVPKEISSGQDWRALLEQEPLKEEIEVLERHTRTGRPLGDLTFLKEIEIRTGKQVIPKKPGPKGPK